jgi:homoserine kinase
MSITVYAPASMGNVGVGFDLLGAALAPVDGSLLGDRVTVSAAPDGAAAGISLTLCGPWVHKLPQAPQDNIVYQCAEFFLSEVMGRTQAIVLVLEKNLPVGSGLGSSASSVVATLHALNLYFGRPCDEHRLLALMGQFEGKISGAVHYDNVAPSYLGGMQLMLNVPGTVCQPIPCFEHWYWVVAYPGISLSTAKMRALLPQQYALATTIDFGRNLSAFVHACYRADEALAVAVLKDVLAEPFRAGVIPGYAQARTGLAGLGMLASGISGSGPSLFSVTDSLQQAQDARDWLAANFLQQDGFVHVCQLDRLGARQVN